MIDNESKLKAQIQELQRACDAKDKAIREAEKRAVDFRDECRAVQAERDLLGTQLAWIAQILDGENPGDLGESFELVYRIIDLQAELETAEACMTFNWELKKAEESRAEQYSEAILWALGENGDFPPRKEEQGAYWWRKELRHRAGMTANEKREGAADTNSSSRNPSSAHHCHRSDCKS